MFGKEFGESSYKVAKRMGNNKSLGKCALAIGDALSMVLGESVACKFRGNAYQWLPKVESDLGKKYWTFLKQSKDTTKLPAGTLVIWDRQQLHPYGHIEVADGKGNLCSDFIRSDKLAIYKSNPANIVPKIFVPNECVSMSVNKELPYDVKVTADILNIRKSSTTDSDIVAKANKNDILTVWAIETKGDHKWGKNSKGFFALEYTERI